MMEPPSLIFVSPSRYSASFSFILVFSTSTMPLLRNSLGGVIHLIMHYLGESDVLKMSD